jgi:hypothetical protein
VSLALCSCGYPGGPLAPTLDVPAFATDFRAWESGANIDMEFTLPKVTTEGQPLKSVRSVELGVAESAAQLSDSSAKHYPIPATAPGPISFQIPARDLIGKTVVLGVRATGPKGKVSAWSNPSVLTVIQPLAAPTALKLDNIAQGVAITWTGPGPRYRIFRSDGDGDAAQIGQTSDAAYVDVTTTYGTRYRYFVQTIAEPNQWSEVSGTEEITPVDKFPPAVPTGLTALGSAQSIELSWSRNTESDLRGYNLFRSVDGGPAVKLNTELLTAPAFSDTKVAPNMRYAYTVSAVDATGNESAQSAPQEATL